MNNKKKIFFGILLIFMLSIMNVFKTDVVEATTIDVPTNEGKIKATNIKINPTYLNKGDIIEMYSIFPRTNNNNDFDCYFFKARPRVSKDIEKNFNVTYYISNEDPSNLELEKIRLLEYKVEDFKVNLNTVDKDVRVLKIELEAKEYLNNFGDLSIQNPVYISKSNKDKFGKLESTYKIRLYSQNRNVNINPNEIDINFKYDVDYNLEVNDLSYYVGDEFDKINLIDVATRNGEDVLKDVDIIFPEGKNEDNITNESGEYNIILKLPGIEKESKIKVVKNEEDVNKEEITNKDVTKNKRRKKEQKYLVRFIKYDEIEYKIDRIAYRNRVDKPEGPIRKGFIFEGWYTDNSFKEKYDFSEPVISDMDLISKWKPIHRYNTESHFAYMKGYPDGSIKGNDEIKRSEAATVIYRILSNDYIDSIKIKESNYIDIGKDDWYKEYMDFLYSADIIKGYPDGEFKPDEKISRAEAVNMLFYLDETSSLVNKYKDLDKHWARNKINIFSELELVKGYEDDTFRPDELITRAEFAQIINNILGRKTEKKYMLEERREFFDLDESMWSYEILQEATNDHEFKLLDNGIEKWINIK